MAELGPIHPATISAKEMLGWHLADHGSFPEVHELYSEMWEWTKLVQGVDSIQVVDAERAVAKLLLKQTRP